MTMSGHSSNKYRTDHLLTIRQSDKLKKWKDKYRNDEHLINRPNWDKFYMEMAMVASKRSHDAQSQFGCVLVNSNNKFIDIGYNGFIRDVDDYVLPNLRPAKYSWMVHAEHNAILNCAFQGKSTKGATAYVTGESCLWCLQYMWQAGISQVIYSRIHSAQMVQVDDEYIDNLAIFKFLTKDKMSIIEILKK